MSPRVSQLSLSTHIEDWLTIQDAAKELQTSPRTLERKIARREIEAAKRPRPGKRAETVVNPKDLQELQPTAFVVPAAAGPTAEGKGAVKPAANLQSLRAQQNRSTGMSPHPLEILAAALLHQQQQPARGQWIDLEEASLYSGLSPKLLKKEIRAGRLTAVRDEHTWKTTRKALDCWQPQRRQTGNFSHTKNA